MTLEQLRIFLSVAEHLHFTQAANELFLTQSAVSSAIRRLELEYRVQFFHRIGRRVELTDAGELLKTSAQVILSQVVQTEKGLRELNDLSQGELSIASSPTLANYWLPERISRFKSQYPGITVNCSLMTEEEVTKGVMNGVFDLGIVSGEVSSELQKGLDKEIIGTDKLQIIVGQSHPWFREDKIMVDDLLKASWVLRESTSGIQKTFESYLSHWGISVKDLKVIFVLNSSEMVKAVVETGVGIGVIPELMVRKELQLNSLRGIQVFHPSSHLSLSMVRSVVKLKHLQRFQTRISKVFEQMLS